MLSFAFAILIFFSGQLKAAGVAVYSEATDVFELMDNVSKWHPSIDSSYRQEWERKFPLSVQDKAQFIQYAEIRKKFANNSGEAFSTEEDVFGSPVIGYDIFSEAFYSRRSVGDALKKLSLAGLSPAELTFLKNFYSSNKKKISSFISESSQFAVKLLSLNKQWKTSGIDKVIKKITPFILGKNGRRMKLTLRPVWWPSSKKPRVDRRGPFLILRYHPLAHSGKWDMDDISKSAILSIIHSQSANQRQNLTKVFEARCRGRSIELRESLNLLFSKMLPESYKRKKNFDLYKKWDRRSFTDLMVKLLFPLLQDELKARGSFAGRFMTQAADLCRSLNRLAVIP
jgi:hypothetical protein